MQNIRRKFILTAGLTMGAAMSGFPLLASGKISNTPENDVLGVVSRYGVGTETRRASGSVEYTVKMRSHQDFADTFTGERPHPFERIFASGNTLTFEHRGTSFTIKNVA
jgi:hypothetical protein